MRAVKPGLRSNREAPRKLQCTHARITPEGICFGAGGKTVQQRRQQSFLQAWKFPLDNSTEQMSFHPFACAPSPVSSQLRCQREPVKSQSAPPRSSESSSGSWSQTVRITVLLPEACRACLCFHSAHSPLTSSPRTLTFSGAAPAASRSWCTPGTFWS